MNVRFEGFDRTGLAFLSEEQADELRNASVRCGDVLLNITGASIGRVTQVPPELDGARVNQHVCIIRPTEKVTGRFLALYLSSPSAQEKISSEHYGATRQALTKSQVLDFEFPLPPLAEQERIVAKLDDVMARLSAARQRLDKIPKLLARFRQSVLAAACSGQLTADWRAAHPEQEPSAAGLQRLGRTNGGRVVRRGVPEWVPFPEILGQWPIPATWVYQSAAELLRCGALLDIKDGNHGANHPRVSEFSDEGLPFITAAQVKGFRIDYEGAYKVAGEPLARIRIGFAKSGDVIYTHKGSIGRVAVCDRECVLTPQTTYYRVSPDAIVSEFLMYFLTSAVFSSQVDGVKEQTTRDFVPISEQYLLYHCIPPLAEQHEIVRRVSRLLNLLDQLEIRFHDAEKRTNQIVEATLTKAFRGDLV